MFTAQANTERIGDPRNGDAKIEAQLTLPDQCVAPIVFVTSATWLWFAATGIEPPPLTHP